MKKPAGKDPFGDPAGILKALAHPLRLKLVCGLCHEPRSLSRIAGALGVPLSTLALHLGVLRRAGLLVEEKRGAEVVFRLEDRRVRLILDALCEGCGVSAVDWGWSRLAGTSRGR